MGKLIAIDGTDGAGKSTQMELLWGNLDRRANIVAGIEIEPTHSDFGRFIRDVINKKYDVMTPEHMTILFAADRVEHMVRHMQPKLAQGQWLICDRYVLSSIAYQSIADDPTLVKGLNSVFLVPDMYIFIDVPVKISLERLRRSGKAHDIYEREEVLNKVYDNYKLAIEWYEGLTKRPVTVINGEGTEDSVAERIWEQVKSIL